MTEASSEEHRPQKQETTIIDVLEAADSKLLLKLMELSGMLKLLEDTGKSVRGWELSDIFIFLLLIHFSQYSM